MQFHSNSLDETGSVRVWIDAARGVAYLGSQTLVVESAGEQGELRAGGPQGPTLRPLRFLERSRAAWRARTAPDPIESLCAEVLDLATVKTGEGEAVMLQILALHLAGAMTDGLAASFSETALAVGRGGGWDLRQIEQTEAAFIDLLAGGLLDLEPVASESGSVTVLLFSPAPADELEGLRRSLAHDLLRRGKPTRREAERYRSRDGDAGGSPGVQAGTSHIRSESLDPQIAPRGSGWQNQDLESPPGEEWFAPAINLGSHTPAGGIDSPAGLEQPEFFAPGQPEAVSEPGEQVLLHPDAVDSGSPAPGLVPGDIENGWHESLDADTDHGLSDVASQPEIPWSMSVPRQRAMPPGDSARFGESQAFSPGDEEFYRGKTTPALPGQKLDRAFQALSTEWIEPRPETLGIDLFDLTRLEDVADALAARLNDEADLRGIDL